MKICGVSKPCVLWNDAAVHTGQSAARWLHGLHAAGQTLGMATLIRVCERGLRALQHREHENEAICIVRGVLLYAFG